MMDEILTTIAEAVTTAAEQTIEAIPETVTEVVTQTAPTLTPHPENVMHNLFSILGCDLDHVPASEFEAFTMALQFLSAALFLFWFFKFIWNLMKSVYFTRW